MAKKFDFLDDTKLAYQAELQMHVWQGIQTTFVFSFSNNVCYPNQTFLCLDFSLFSLRGFGNAL